MESSGRARHRATGGAMGYWGRGVFLGLSLAGALHGAGAAPGPGPAASPEAQALPDLEDGGAASAPLNALKPDQALPPLRHAVEIRLGVGARWFNQIDSDQLFLGNNLVGGQVSSSENMVGGPSDALQLSLAFGYQHPSGPGIEVGFSPLPLESVYAMPLYRLASPSLGSRPALHTLGAQFGWATIYGQSDYYAYYNSNNGNYLNSDVQMNTYAVVYRIEEMLNARLSLGLELAYHFAWADAHYTHYDSGTYTDHQETLNYSGPSVVLTLAAWPLPPFWTAKDQAAADGRLSRRERRLEDRLERIAARRAAGEESREYDSAAEAKDAGAKAMDASHYGAARSAFQEATLLAPGDSQAWRGLANAEYAMGKRAKAYTHYKEALRLAPDDKPLREFVAKLKARLRQDLDLD